MESRKNKKEKQNRKNDNKEKVEIIITFLNEPSEQAIKNLNLEWWKILQELERDGKLD